MNSRNNAKPEWFTIFRTNEGDEWLYEELLQGRLRQGWGAPGYNLITPSGKPVEKVDWEESYRRRSGWGDPSPMRFAILNRMLDLDDGDYIIMPKMPTWDQFTVARVRGSYRFEIAEGRDDFGHIVPVYRDSVRTFAHRANNKSFLVSALFARANHRPAISFCYSVEHIAAVHQLLEMQSNLSEKSRKDLLAAAMDDAFRIAAESFAETVAGWNGPIFEDAVRQRFNDLGYQVKNYKRYDGEGSDMDMVVSPPLSLHTPFQPAEIAVQVKWKQGVDEEDKWAVEQIRRWAEWQGSNATKYVISTASGFTEEAWKDAAANGVELIGGLQTMCFLLGLADRYRADWEKP